MDFETELADIKSHSRNHTFGEKLAMYLSLSERYPNYFGKIGVRWLESEQGVIECISSILASNIGIKPNSLNCNFRQYGLDMSGTSNKRQCQKRRSIHPGFHKNLTTEELSNVLTNSFHLKKANQYIGFPNNIDIELPIFNINEHAFDLSPMPSTEEQNDFHMQNFSFDDFNNFPFNDKEKDEGGHDNFDPFS